MVSLLRNIGHHTQGAGVNTSQNSRILPSGKVSYFELIRDEFPNFVHRPEVLLSLMQGHLLLKLSSMEVFFPLPRKMAKL